VVVLGFVLGFVLFYGAVRYFSNFDSHFALRYSSKRTVTHRMLSYVNFSAGLVHPPP